MATDGKETTLHLGAALRGARLADPDAPLPRSEGRQVGNLPPRPEPPPPGPSAAELARLAEMRARIEAALDAIDRRTDDWMADRARDWDELPRVAVELAVALAARLLRDRLQARDFPVEAIVRELLGEVSATAPAVVYLCPDDLALLEARLVGAALADRPGPVSYAADAALAPGDCRVEAGDTVLLAEMSAQLAAARRRWLEELGHAPA